MRQKRTKVFLGALCLAWSALFVAPAKAQEVPPERFSSSSVPLEVPVTLLQQRVERLHKMRKALEKEVAQAYADRAEVTGTLLSEQAPTVSETLPDFLAREFVDAKPTAEVASVDLATETLAAPVFAEASYNAMVPQAVNTLLMLEVLLVRRAWAKINDADLVGFRSDLMRLEQLGSVSAVGGLEARMQQTLGHNGRLSTAVSLAMVEGLILLGLVDLPEEQHYSLQLAWDRHGLKGRVPFEPGKAAALFRDGIEGYHNKIFHTLARMLAGLSREAKSSQLRALVRHGQDMLETLRPTLGMGIALLVFRYGESFATRAKHHGEQPLAEVLAALVAEGTPRRFSHPHVTQTTLAHYAQIALLLLQPREVIKANFDLLNGVTRKAPRQVTLRGGNSVPMVTFSADDIARAAAFVAVALGESGRQVEESPFVTKIVKQATEGEAGLIAAARNEDHSVELRLPDSSLANKLINSLGELVDEEGKVQLDEAPAVFGELGLTTDEVAPERHLLIRFEHGGRVPKATDHRTVVENLRFAVGLYLATNEAVVAQLDGFVADHSPAEIKSARKEVARLLNRLLTNEVVSATMRAEMEGVIERFDGEPLIYLSEHESATARLADELLRRDFPRRVMDHLPVFNRARLPVEPVGRVPFGRLMVAAPRAL